MIADTLRRQTDLTDDAVEQLMRWACLLYTSVERGLRAKQPEIRIERSDGG